MHFESVFNINDKIWVSHNNLPLKLTVGKIIIEHTDSPGIEGEELFDNYKPQQKHTEKYMCIETGIGTGMVYEFGKNIFKSSDDCLKAIPENKEP